MSLKKGKFQHNQSKSLWNYTLSPGWREEEVKILKNALQLFGIGKWKKIMESGCLPGKSIGQIYMQTQRLLGQQSLGDFMGLQIDLEAVFQQNMKKQDVLRKNNCIINTGDNPTKEERKRRIEQNRKIYGLSAKQIGEIKLPKVKKHAPQYMTLEDIENEKFTNLEILTHLYNLKAEIVRRLAEQGETIPQPSILKSLNNLNNHDDTNQNSNSSETKVTLEQSGKKKYKVLAIEEVEVQNGVNAQKKSINGKRKNNRKINSDSEGEEDISLEDIDSEESEIDSEEIVEDDDEDQEIKEPSKIKKRKKNPESEEENEVEGDEELEEEEDQEDEMVVNEEEIFEDDDEDDEDNQDSSEDGDDEED